MNGLNCESKSTKSKTLWSCIITAVISVVLCLLILLIVFCNIPGLLDLVSLNIIVNNNYYGDISDEEIANGVLGGYISGLKDRYGQYLTQDESEARTDRLNGISKGLGMTVLKNFNSEDIYVSKVYNDSPAFKAGILKGDLIVSVDSNSVSEIGYQKAVDSIPRKVGETVKLTVFRDNVYLDFEIIYSDVTQQTVFYELYENLGYVEVTSFNQATVEQFYNAVNDLQADGVKGLVFDLRDNSGGTVDSVGKMLDFLLPEGDLMTVKYKNGTTDVMLKSDSEHIDLPMAVLVNENTASAAEVFSSNVRELGNGVLVGKKTFGKGIMQDTFRLPSGSSVVFTVAELFTHNMTSYHSVGLNPDYEVSLSNEETKMRYFYSLSEDKTFMKAVDLLEEKVND